MIEMAGLLTALLLPGLVGFVWLDVLWCSRFLAESGNPENSNPGNPAASPVPMMLGYGYLFGIAYTAFVMRALDTVGQDQRFWLVALVLMATGAAGLVVRHRQSPRPAWRHVPAGRPSSWAMTATVLLAALIFAHFYLAASEVLLRPLYPWDAFASWAQKTRVWYELGRMVPFVPAAEWRGGLDPGRFTVIASQYPPTIPLIQVWTLLGLGRWDDVLMNTPWLLCAGALGLALYGQLRLWGLSMLGAITAVYLLVSLPMLDTHTALAGYADLWMAATYTLAAMAVVQWCRSGDRRQVVLAIGAILIATQIKREGMIWTLTLTPAIMLDILPRRGLYTLLAVLVALGLGIAALLTAGGVALDSPMMGDMAALAEGVTIPWLGTVYLGFSNVSGPLVDSMAVDDNWHLLWYAAAVLLLFAPWARAIRSEPGFSAAYVTVAAGLGLVLGTFFFTNVSAWAFDLTTVNRVLLHMAPTVVFALAVAFDALVRSDT